VIEIFQLPFIYSLILFFLKRKLNEVAYCANLPLMRLLFRDLHDTILSYNTVTIGGDYGNDETKNI